MLIENLIPLGFSYEKDTRLYFDDTCVVPERLEGKNLAPEKGWQVTWAHGGRFGAAVHSSQLLRLSSAGMVLWRAAEHCPIWLLGITATQSLPAASPACSTVPSTLHLSDPMA